MRTPPATRSIGKTHPTCAQRALVVKLLGEIGSAAKDAIPALKVVLSKPPKRAVVMPAGYAPLTPLPAYTVPGTLGTPPPDPFEQSVKEVIDKIEGKPKK